MSILKALCASVLALAPATLFAEGLDRDTLLTEAPATPDRGTVRVSGGGNGQVHDTANQSGLSGSIMWSPVSHLAGDIGAYWQGRNAGPTARVRYQFLSQALHGFDLAGGVRYKSVGFLSSNGEAEFLLAGGRKFGHIDVMMNVVLGKELGGAGMDAEIKAFAGYRFGATLRAGIDGRVQGEFRDETGFKRPDLTNDVDITVGPAVGWMPIDRLQLQGVVGAAKPKGLATASPAAILMITYDF
jgi:hypothetical protein